MVLSKRERYIALAAAGTVLLLGLDHVVLAPLLAAKVNLDSQIGIAQQQLDRARRIFTNSRHKRHQWADMQNKGLRLKDASEAESLVLNSIRDWAQDAGMSLSSVKPERTEKEKNFQKSTFRATGTGGMAQIGRFLWYIQSATIPVRISDLQINTRKEGADELTLQLGICTIYLPHEPEKDKDQPAPAASSQEVRR